MTKEETIKVLQSIEDRAVDFPNMTACDWVAIAAAKRHLTNISETTEVDYNNTIIERACELLARMIWEVTYEDLEGNSVQHYDKMEFIEDFKKYMKGGEE